MKYELIRLMPTTTTGCFEPGPNADLCYWFSQTGNEDMIRPAGWQGESVYLRLVPDVAVPHTIALNPPVTMTVPEPATAVLLGFGLILAAIFTARRRI